MAGPIEIRIFFTDGSGKAIEGSHARAFPAIPTVGQTMVFGRPAGEIAVYRVAETGFYVWPEGASAWALVAPVSGAHRAPAGFYDPLAETL